MKHTPVQSSNIESYAYDEPSHRLELRFLGGGLYEYLGFLPSHFAALEAECKSGGSIGKYFHTHIKGIFPYNKIGR